MKIHKTKMYFINHGYSLNSGLGKHVFWHNIYLGFGFIPNYLGITYDDDCAIKKIKNIDPNIKEYSEKYESLLKKETIRILLKERIFAWSTIFAKFGVCLFYLLVCMNIGSLAAVLFKQDMYLHSCFLIVLLTAALPGILVMPRPSYLSGFTALAFVYGLYCFVPLFMFLQNKIKKIIGY